MTHPAPSSDSAVVATGAPTTVLRPSRFTQALAVVALAALGVSIYLTIVSTSDMRVAGCSGDGGGCDEILATRWSTWLGVPTSCLAAGTWLVGLVASIAAALVRGRGARRTAWSAVLFVGLVAGGAAVWFIGLQLFMVRAICPYCMTAHGLGLLFLLLGVAALARSQIGLGPGRVRLVALLALAALATLIGGQLLQPDSRHIEMNLASLPGDAAITPDADRFPSPAAPPSTAGGPTPRANAAPVITDTGPGPDRILSVGRYFSFNPHHVATIGSPDAPYAIITFFCYTCPHCRDLFHLYDRMRQRYDPSQFFIVAIPAPVDGRCNPLFAFKPTSKSHQGACEYARIALAVWNVDPNKFHAYQTWFFEPDKRRPPQEARAYAARLVGEQAFAAAMKDPQVALLLRQGIDQIGSLPASKVSLPMTFLGRDVVLAGLPAPEALFQLVEQEFGLQPRR